MDDIQFWGIIIAFTTNIIILITQAIQVYKLKKELKEVKLVINSTSELKRALNKPFEGIWEVRGFYAKYHNIELPHDCTGFADITWNDENKRYDIVYTYSVRQTKAPTDLVTAICRGTSTCDENGYLNKNKKLILNMKISNRTSSNGIINNLPSFEFISKKIDFYDETRVRAKKIEFDFSTNNSSGTIYFQR